MSETKINNKKLTEKKNAGFHNGIISAKQESDGTFMILLQSDLSQIPIAFPLTWLIGLIVKNRGSYQSLGMAYNPNTGAQCMEIAIHYSVPVDSQFFSEIETAMSQTVAEYSKNDENS